MKYYTLWTADENDMDCVVKAGEFASIEDADAFANEHGIEVVEIESGYRPDNLDAVLAWSSKQSY